VIERLLQQIFEQEIYSVTAVSGGDINNAFVVNLSNKEQYFVKHNSFTDGQKMFATEAEGLQFLSSHSPFAIPNVIDCRSVEEQHFLILEYVKEGASTEADFYTFGQRLATMHQSTSNRFGLESKNFIGRLPQPNQWESSWKDFYINHRLRYQLKLGLQHGHFTKDVFNKLDRLESIWGTLVPKELPSLLHGDLWSGNYLSKNTGEITIIDPAIYFGHREVDLAMTRLFGGFPSSFYEGYEEIWPLEQGAEERVKLYQLYPILVHANLFGGHYISESLRILDSTDSYRGYKKHHNVKSPDKTDGT